MSINLIQSVRQEQQLCANQIQALNYLAMTAEQLQSSLHAIIPKNPALSVNSPETAIGSFDEYEHKWENQFTGNPEEDAKRQFFLNSIQAAQSLSDELLSQLLLEEDEQQIAEELIGNIDERGFLKISTEEISQKLNCPLAEVEHILAFLQDELEPPGVLARTTQESFLLQYRRLAKQDPVVIRILTHHFDKLLHPQKLAEELNLSQETIEHALDSIKKLTINPAERLQKVNNAEIITPDFLIFEDQDQQWHALVNDTTIPQLRLNDPIPELSDDENKENLRQAKQIIDAVSRRTAFLQKFIETILQMQYDFFSSNNDYFKLKPLTLKMLAEKLEVHLTTISRAAKGKYIKTPTSIIAVKHLFGAGIHHHDSTEVTSNRAIKTRIAQLIHSEEWQNPLSDRELTEILNQEGFKISRRTVAKYRTELHIPKQNQRMNK